MEKIKALFDGNDYIVYFKDAEEATIDKFNMEYDPEICSDAYVKPIADIEFKFPDGNGKASGLTPSEVLENFGNSGYIWLLKRRKYKDEMLEDITEAMCRYLKSKYSYISDSLEETSGWSLEKCNQFFKMCDVCISDDIKSKISEGYIDYQTFLENAGLEKKQMVIAAVLDKLLK